MTDPERGASEVTEVLDRAWQLIEEANDLVLYATRLIENTTLREQMVRVKRELHDVKFAYVRLAQAWDVIPECQAIHRRRSPTAVELDRPARRDPEPNEPRPVGDL